MKPAPFRDVLISTPDGRFTIKSTQSARKSLLRSGQQTDIIDSNGVVVWSASFFLGRHVPHPDPNGARLLLLGDYYYGWNIMRALGNPILATLYDQEEQLQTIKFDDIFDQSLRQIIQANRFPVRGGGWIEARFFLEPPAITWESDEIRFRRFDGETRTLTLAVPHCE